MTLHILHVRVDMLYPVQYYINFHTAFIHPVVDYAVFTFFKPYFKYPGQKWISVKDEGPTRSAIS